MLVTVIIPSYNHSQYVLQAIDSVLAQSWPNIELIVIDDGSTDGSSNLIRAHHERSGGYRFICRNNQGLVKTLNEGLQMATGEFFCELASDDFFTKDSIAKRATYLQEHPECVAVFANGWRVNGDELTEELFVDEKRKQMFASVDPIPAMLEGALPVFSTGMIRKDLFVDIGGFDEQTFRYYEDLEPPFLLSLAGRFGYLDKPVICRRSHDTNVSSVTPYIRFEKIALYQKLLLNSRLSSYQTLVKKNLCRSYLQLARQLPDYPKVLKDHGIKLLAQAWPFVAFEPRLLWYLLRSSC